MGAYCDIECTSAHAWCSKWLLPFWGWKNVSTQGSKRTIVMKCGGICGGTEKYQAPPMEGLFTHTHTQFLSGENERWISYSRWMLITVFYGGNAITRYCFLSREPCKFMRLEIWNNEAWQGMSVPSTHLPLSEWWGKLISLCQRRGLDQWACTFLPPFYIQVRLWIFDLKWRQIDLYLHVTLWQPRTEITLIQAEVSQSNIFFFNLEKWGLE